MAMPRGSVTEHRIAYKLAMLLPCLPVTLREPKSLLYYDTDLYAVHKPARITRYRRILVCATSHTLSIKLVT